MLYLSSNFFCFCTRVFKSTPISIITILLILLKSPLASSTAPTVSPSILPSSSVPSIIPTGISSKNPSNFPSRIPSYLPSNIPISNPTASPSCQPSSYPSTNPANSVLPTTWNPSAKPSALPSALPIATPTLTPSSIAPNNYTPQNPSDSKYYSFNSASEFWTVIGISIAAFVILIFITSIMVCFYLSWRRASVLLSTINNNPHKENTEVEKENDVEAINETPIESNIENETETKNVLLENRRASQISTASGVEE